MGNIARRRATPAKPSSSVDGCQESFTTVVTLLGPARSAQGVVNFNQPVLLLTLSCSPSELRPQKDGGSTSSVLCRGTYLVLFIDYWRFSSLTEPGLGAPLNSYHEGALYKFSR